MFYQMRPLDRSYIIQGRRGKGATLFVVSFSSVSRCAQPSNRPSLVPVCKPDVLSSDNSYCTWNVQGVWRQVQLQGHAIPSTWLSHFSSQATGTTAGETHQHQTRRLMSCINVMETSTLWTQNIVCEECRSNSSLDKSPLKCYPITDASRPLHLP